MARLGPGPAARDQWRAFKFDTWRKAGNPGHGYQLNGTDFALVHTGGEDTLFHMIEVTRR